MFHFRVRKRQPSYASMTPHEGKDHEHDYFFQAKARPNLYSRAGMRLSNIPKAQHPSLMIMDNLNRYA